MVVVQHPAKSFTTLHFPAGPPAISERYKQLVRQTLVIALTMVVLQVLSYPFATLVSLPKNPLNQMAMHVGKSAFYAVVVEGQASVIDA